MHPWHVDGGPPMLTLGELAAYADDLEARAAAAARARRDAARR